MLTTPRGQPLPLGNRVWERRYLPDGLASQLRDARVAQRLSLREAALLVGITAGYLSRLERGLRCPRMPTALRLAAVLDLDDDVAEALLDEAVVG